MLTPDDIVDYPLKLAVRGYSVPQVDELLDQVADTIDQLRRRVEELEEQLHDNEERLASASETEDTLKRTLVTAQRAAEQSLEEARAEAERLRDDARREAEAELEAARSEAAQLRDEAVRTARAEEARAEDTVRELERRAEDLRDFEREHRQRLRRTLEEHLRWLDGIGEVPDPPSWERPDDDPASIPPEVADLLEATGGREPGQARHLTVRIHEEERGAVEGEETGGGGQ